jgi:hypothetical protein
VNETDFGSFSETLSSPNNEKPLSFDFPYPQIKIVCESTKFVRTKPENKYLPQK